ncbi:hypothetical protein [Sphingomonas faeni]|uniref:hypothetical protein n=1 Tax=Sphingomonas faeni TaxID=185950 RepID=UPI0020C7C743|nr:hypothetical protein [Sphingomonas faeni]MCP8892143.1 hypothetical protein [Sphingomonas faeni]
MIIPTLMLLTMSASDVEPEKLSAYIDCLYQADGQPADKLTNRRVAVAAQLRKCVRLRQVGVQAEPFYKPRFDMIDANFRKSQANAKN